MSTNPFEQFQQFNPFQQLNNFEPLSSLQALNQKTFEQLTRQQLGAASELVQSNTKNLNKFSTAKRVDEVISISNSLVSEAASKALEMAQQAFDQALSTNTEYSKWFEDNMVANFKKANEEVVTKSKSK